MARVFAPTLNPERVRVNRNGVPIPPTPCQMAQLQHTVARSYEHTPKLGTRIINEVQRIVLTGKTSKNPWSLSAVARQYCTQFLNGF